MANLLESFGRKLSGVLHGGALLIAASLALAGPARADIDKRVALVIGNGAYAAAPKLTNPTEDAHAVAASLKRLGFVVVEGYDLNGADMHAKIGDFSDQLAGAKAALVYYAGHGVAFQDDNYLLPIDIVLKSPADLDLKAVNLSTVLKLMKREDAIDVVILDACRNNPFAEELSRSAKSRGLFLDGGLTKVDSDLARGTLIAFATDPRKTALDGTPGGHSPFTKALLAHLEDPGVPIDTMFSRVRTDVDAATAQQQTPWVNTSLIGEFMLNPLAVDASMAAQTGVAVASNGGVSLTSERLALDDKLWAAADKSNTAEDYQAYVDAVPNGAFVQMAKNRMTRLASRSAGTSVAVAAPTVPPATPAAATPDSGVSDAFKAENASKTTEDTLNLDQKSRMDVESRLMALGFDPGDFSGAFTFKTRASISEWQKRRGAPVSGYLGPQQYSALLKETPDLAPPKVASRSATAGGSDGAAPAPVVKKKKKLPVREQAAAAPAQQSGMSAAGAFLGGAILGGVLGAAIHH